jgi:glycosyltransferase involved in cell wall biosynthesis
MIRVLHLIKKYTGNSPLLNEYVKALPKEQFPSVVCYLEGTPDGRNEIETVASDVRYLEREGKDFKFLSQAVIRSVFKLMKAEKIDIVHCHRHRPTVIGTIASIIAGVPYVISHVHGLSRTRSIQRYITNWLLFKKVKKIIAVSDSVRMDIIRTNRNLEPLKVVTVRNGIDLALIDNVSITRKEARLRLGIQGNEIVFGTVGRLTKTKGQIYLLDAYAKISNEIPHSRLVIVGKGPLSKELNKQADDLGISSQVLFTGYRTDVRELLKGFDVFVLPSIAEGLSIALLEAMASRLPVIASNVGGIPEVVDCNSGFLFPSKNSNAIAEAMNAAAQLKEKERAIVGNAARKRVEETFTAAIMQKNIFHLYTSMVHS